MENYRRISNFQGKYFTDGGPGWNYSSIVYILSQLHIDEELCVCLAVSEILYNNIIGFIVKIFIRNSLHLERQIKRTIILKRYRRSPLLTFLSRHLNHTNPFILLIEGPQAHNIRYYTLRSNGNIHWLQIAQSNLHYAIDRPICCELRDLYCNFYVRPFSSFYFEAYFLVVLHTVATTHREHIFIQTLKLLILTQSNNPQYVRRLFIITFRVSLLHGTRTQTHGKVDFVNSAGDETRLPKNYLISI